MNRPVRSLSALLLIALACAPALAQDRGWDLERENARLRARLKLVEARLEALEHLVREQTMLLEELNAWARRGDRPRGEHPPAREGDDERRAHAQAGFEKLRARLRVAAERLGKRHELVRAFANHLEELQELVRSGRWDAAHAAFQRAHQLLERIEHAEVRQKEQGEPRERGEDEEGRRPGQKEQPRQDDKALRRFEEARQKFADAHERYGPDHPELRELVEHVEELFVALKDAWERDLEKRKTKMLAPLGKRVKEHEKELKRRHKQAMKEVELIAKRMAQIKEVDPSDPQLEQLAQRREAILEKTERELTDAKQRVAAALSEAERDVEERVAIEARELRERLERLRKSVRLY